MLLVMVYMHRECEYCWENRGTCDEIMNGLCTMLKNLHIILEMLRILEEF